MERNKACKLPYKSNPTPGIPRRWWRTARLYARLKSQIFRPSKIFSEIWKIGRKVFIFISISHPRICGIHSRQQHRPHRCCSACFRWPVRQIDRTEISVFFQNYWFFFRMYCFYLVHAVQSLLIVEIANCSDVFHSANAIPPEAVLNVEQLLIFLKNHKILVRKLTDILL